MDGNLHGVRAKMEDGEDIFTNHPGGLAAVSKYSSELENLPRMMIDNITTWESNWLDTNGKLNTKAIEEALDLNTFAGVISMGTDLFTSTYFGGNQARMRYLHLVWEEIYLSPDGGIEKLKQRILAGENLFHGEIGQAALTKWSGLLQILPFEPHDHLDTWERFWLGNKPGSTYKLWRKTQEHRLNYITTEDRSPFSLRMYGGRQAQERYGYIEWESRFLNSPANRPPRPSGFDFNSNSDTSTTDVRICIMMGRDVFRQSSTDEQKRVQQSAKRKWGFLLNSFSCQPRDDTETWDYFHLEELIRTLHLGEYVEKVADKYLAWDYYGALHAVDKYGASWRRDSSIEWIEQHAQAPAIAWTSHAGLVRIVVGITVRRAIMRKAFNGALSLALNAPSCEDDQYTADSACQRRPQTLISYGSVISYAWNRRLIQPARTSTTFSRETKRWTTVAVDDDELSSKQYGVQGPRISCFELL